MYSNVFIGKSQHLVLEYTRKYKVDDEICMSRDRYKSKNYDQDKNKFL